MPAPTITPLPTPPSRSQSPETFSTDADAFLGALPDFATEANDQADYLDTLAAAVDADATAASNAAAVAIGAANYQGDYSAGTTYQIGESVSYNSYRWVAKTVNTGVTPADGANWFRINDGDILGPASATNNALVLFDGTTGKLLKNGVGNGTLGALLASGGSGAAPSYLGQGTSGQVLISGGSGALPTWGNPLPSQTGNEGKFLSTDGINPSWVAVGSAVGDILYSTQAPSASWLACNGATYLQSSYPALYAKLGILGTPYAATWNLFASGTVTNAVYYSSSENLYYGSMRSSQSSNGNIRSSTDGITFTNVTNSSGNVQYHVDYVSNRFIGYDNWRTFHYTSAAPFNTSTTFNTFDLTSFFVAGNYNLGAIYGMTGNRSNGDIMAVGKRAIGQFESGAAIATCNISAPQSWTARTPPVSSNGTYIESVASDSAGTWIIQITNGGNDVVYRSQNLGASWATMTVGSNLGSCRSVSYSNGFFYAVFLNPGSTFSIARYAVGGSWVVTYTGPTSGGSTINQQLYSAINTSPSSINFVKTPGSLIMTGYNMSNSPINGNFLVSSDNGTTWYAYASGFSSPQTLSVARNDGSYANGRIFAQVSYSGTISSYTSTGFSYNTSTQFVVPNYGSLSTFSSTYAAPVSAFIKAA